MLSPRRCFYPTFLSVIVAALIFVLWGSNAQAAEVIRWRLGNPVAEGDSFTGVLRKFADDVSAESGGRIRFKIVQIDTIGFKSADSLRVLRQGVVEAMFVFPQYVTRDEPLLGAMMPQGGLLDITDNAKIIDIQEKIAAEILTEKWNLAPVTRLVDRKSSRIGIVSKVAVNSLDELRKYKLRQFNKEGISAYNRLGVSTQLVPSHELYLAMRMGIVDAAIYSLSYTKSQGLYDVACCFSEIGYYTLAAPSLIVARVEDWNSLTVDIQNIMKDVGRRIFAENMREAISGVEEAQVATELVGKGMHVLPPFSYQDRKAVQEALLAAWAEKCEKLGPVAVRNRKRILEALNSGE